MSDESDNTAEGPASLDGDEAARDLRQQIAAVKARMADHRAAMQAVGLAPPGPRKDAEAGAS